AQIAASNLVAADVATAIVGARAGAVVAGLALLVVLASLNGNIFVTPRVLFGLAREGLAPGALARVNRGGTPWGAMLLVGAVGVGVGDVARAGRGVRAELGGEKRTRGVGSVNSHAKRGLGAALP